MQFPNIDPVLLTIGPLKVHWYGIAYVVGILLGWAYYSYLIKRDPKVMTKTQLDDFITWFTLGIVLGGRLGEVLFYHPIEYLHDPIKIFYIWEGGMSFHGGLLGVVVVTTIFSIKHKIAILNLCDIIASAVPIGLFLGRIANFVNGELYGRVTDSSLGIVFPNGGPFPRHPSQLYEALGEGIILFIIMFILEHTTNIRKERPGLMFAVFLIGYSIARGVVELYRQPDAHIGFLIGGLTMGQLLSVPLLLSGVILMIFAFSQKKA